VCFAGRAIASREIGSVMTELQLLGFFRPTADRVWTAARFGVIVDYTRPDNPPLKGDA